MDWHNHDPVRHLLCAFYTLPGPTHLSVIDIFRIPGIGLEKYHQTADVVIGAARKRLLYLPSTRWTGNTERAWKGGWDEFNLDLD